MLTLRSVGLATPGVNEDGIEKRMGEGEGVGRGGGDGVDERGDEGGKGTGAKRPEMERFETAKEGLRLGIFTAD
ncbi:MAG: hypothetical protein Q9169_008332 [Polycauliona sp. 2 TL-2023]